MDEIELVEGPMCRFSGFPNQPCYGDVKDWGFGGKSVVTCCGHRLYDRDGCYQTEAAAAGWLKRWGKHKFELGPRLNPSAIMVSPQPVKKPRDLSEFFVPVTDPVPPLVPSGLWSHLPDGEVC